MSGGSVRRDLNRDFVPNGGIVSKSENPSVNFLAFLPAAAALVVVMPDAALAQNTAGSNPPESVLITGSRGLFGARTDLLGSSYTVLSPVDLELRQVVVVSDALRDVPGVEVNRQGAVGNLTQVRMRGGEANHTLVMIDGIEAGDPFSGEFDFGTLIADDAAKIEVLRGQQSALYGSNAIGGVIQYITATGAEAPGLSAKFEGGSFDTMTGAARAAGVTGALDYALSGSLSRTGGTIGARNGIRHNGSESEGFSGKFIYTLAENFHLTAVGRYNNLDAKTTPQDFDFPPGPNYGLTFDRLPSDATVQVADSTSAKTLYGLVRGDLALMGGQWTHALTIQGVSGERRNYDDVGALSSDPYGTRQKASYVTTFNFATDGAMHALTLAADFKRETYQNKAVGAPPAPFNDERHLDNTGIVGQYDLRIGDDIGFGAAGRYDDNSHFDNAITYRVQGSYRPIEELRLRAAAGTGITNPINFELFGFDPTTFVGNPNLKPEKSEGWEAGADYAFFGDSASVGATYFSSRLRDEIFVAFTPSFLATPQNRATESTEDGVEVWASARIAKQWRLDANWTNLHALESSPGVQEVRRPPNVASLNLSWRAPDDRFGANLTLRYNGEQRDSQFIPTGSVRVPLKAYTLVNLGADYRLDDNWQIYGRVENLFNEKYEEVFAYPSVGLAVYGGLRFRMK
jgi:vitamin B12 transporter